MAEAAASSGEDLFAHPRVHASRSSLAGAGLDAPRRIVSLVPSLSESLERLGLGDRLVGVTEYCVHPPGAFDALPKLGGTKDADVEAIAALRPDLVIANQEENTPRIVRKLAEREIDVWVTYPRTVGEGVELLEAMATLGADRAHRARVVEPARRAFDEARAAQRARAARGATGVRVFCPIWRDPWMTIGRDTYIHDLLALCGGENVFAGGLGGPPGGPGGARTGGSAPGASGSASGDRRYPIVTLEAVEAADPQVIVLPDEPYRFGVRDAAELAELACAAARTGRIALIDGTLVSWYGPRIAEAIRALAAILARAGG
jgi:ABC-type hemin transport system substrate-binding protein